MSEYNREQLSALIDDEAGGEAEFTLQALSNSEEHRQTWSRYHLIGDSLRGELPAQVDMQLADRVKNSIRQEPTVLAPPHPASKFMQPVIGFAIAASVAAVAIIGVQQTNTDPSLTVPSPSVAQQQTKLATEQLASNLTPQNTVPVTIQQLPVPGTVNMDANSRLNRYLVNYNEYRANAGMQGMLPYVRIVSYETEEQE